MLRCDANVVQHFDCCSRLKIELTEIGAEPRTYSIPLISRLFIQFDEVGTFVEWVSLT